MNYINLRAELDGNVPLYGSLTDQQVADELNVVNKVQNRTAMAREEIIEAIDATELNALTGDTLTRVFGVLSDQVNPFGVAQQVFVNAFGGGSSTISLLATLRTETVSRQRQIGLGVVFENDVFIARTM